MIQKQTIEIARDIQKRYGKNYHLATLFLPPTSRDAVFILYAFVRIPDEMVDNPTQGSDVVKQLNDWKKTWEDIYRTGEGDNDIMLATRDVFLSYNIPFEVSIEFIDAMIQDTVQSRYATYDDLRGYMRGSAEVIGVMLTHIFGYTDERALPYAEKLGEAMQLTNFLRDIYEDIVERDRIYLPQEDMRQYAVTEDMIRHKRLTPELLALLRFEIKRNRELYKEANQGIELLNKPAQRAVRLASSFYEGILDEIEARDHNIFAGKVSMSTFKKILVILKTYVR